MEEVKHNERSHALLSASSAHRWMNCTPSAMLEYEETVLNGKHCSVYAEEGTCAHEYLQHKLELDYGRISQSYFDEWFEEFSKNKYWSEEMREHCENAIKFIKELTDAMVDGFGISFEQQVDFSDYVPQGFGTADIIITTNDKLITCDFKYGQGVPVTAYKNEQLLLYLLGSSKELKFIPVDCEAYILQPRLNNYNKFDITYKQLIEWAENVVKPKAELASQGLGKFNPDEHACRFCAIKGKCKARGDAQLNAIRQDFQVVSRDEQALKLNHMDEKSLARICLLAEPLREWLKDVENEAYKRAMSGTKIPLHKLVAGRTFRKIVDDVGLINKLKDNGYTLEEFTETKLKTIGDLEKLVGKTKFAELSEGFVNKPVGQPTLVSEDDKREEIMFTNLEQIRLDFKQ